MASRLNWGDGFGPRHIVINAEVTDHHNDAWWAACQTRVNKIPTPVNVADKVQLRHGPSSGSNGGSNTRKSSKPRSPPNLRIE
jgi:hypothetical protein